MNEKKLVSGLVSIAIPAYKKKWLKEAIVSALSQDYPNIEVIIVDDHSPQNLREVVVPFLIDKRVSYYYNEINTRSVTFSMEKECYIMRILIRSNPWNLGRNMSRL